MSYPLEADYKACPICLDETAAMSNLDPISVDEARSLKKHWDFERYYQQRQQQATAA